MCSSGVRRCGSASQHIVWRQEKRAAREQSETSNSKAQSQETRSHQETKDCAGIKPTSLVLQIRVFGPFFIDMMLDLSYNDASTLEMIMILNSDSIKSGLIGKCDGEHFAFSGFASDLGLRAGQVPVRIRTSLGNRQDFLLQKVTAEKFVYAQEMGCVRLVLFND